MNNKVDTEKRPAFKPINLDASNRVGVCPNCGQDVTKEENIYCNICGIKFDWPKANF